jgi:hypothetical protein
VQYTVEYFRKKVQFPEKCWQINQAKRFDVPQDLLLTNGLQTDES